MPKALLIAEKPSLRKTIENVYNKHKSEIPYEIVFTEQRGHLLTLKMPNELDEDLKNWEWDTLPIQPEDYGGWKYKVIEEAKTGKFLTAKERFLDIRRELMHGGYDFVIHAGDPDQEGELLVRIVLNELKNTLPVKRYWSNDTTEMKVLDALKSLRDDDKEPALCNLFAASIARQHSDWRVGINLSRAATLKLGIRVACGRVKTPIMSIVCQREKDILDFKPTTVYGVRAEYSDDFTGQMFDPTASEDEDSEEKKDDKVDTSLIWFDDKSDAEDVIRSLSSPAVVTDYKKEKTATYAPKLFKLATAQIAANKLGYSASQTLEIIQSLYEKGYLSYPRTDCEYLSSKEDLSAMLKSASSVPFLESFVDSIDSSTVSKVRGTKKWINDSKLEESGHSALVPTTKKPNFDTLSGDEQKIYEMVCKRFVAIFMPPLVQYKKQLIAECCSRSFKSTGKTVVDLGYTVVLGIKVDDVNLPEYKVGDKLTVDRFSIAEKTSVCPKRFTDATLIAMCEAPHKYLEDKSLKALGKELKIGTPATRASIIDELITKDKYLARKKETKGKSVYIVPTDAGMQIFESLKGREICKVDMTGNWELRLADIRAGKLNLASFEENMMKDVKTMCDEIKDADIKALSSSGSGSRESIGTCPECGGDIISTEKGFYCSGYKAGCKMGSYKKICESVISDKDFMSMINGDRVVMKIKKGKISWTQALVYNFEEHKVVFDETKEMTTYTCPGCGAKMTDEGSKLTCPDDCGFSLWKSPCGVTLTKSQLDKFFKEGHTGVVKGMKSKAGKRFDADIVYDKKKNSTSFDFENK